MTFMMSIMLTLVTLLVAGARDSVIRTKTECSMDAALYSVFAEYNRQLLERYDLLFIDTSYGNGQGTPANCAAHLKDYLNRNFRVKSGITTLNARDLLALSVVNTEITDFALATDDKGEVLVRQAADYVKTEYGLNSLERIRKNLQTAKDEGFLTIDVSARQIDNQAQIDNMELPKKQISEEEWEDIPLDNPADAVNSARMVGILSFVLPEENELSTQAVNLSNYVSKRNCPCGSGIGNRKAVTMADRILFDKYILQKADCYTTKDPDGLLRYQMEYVIGGQSDDVGNLKKTVEKLLFIRQAANMTYLFSDGAKIAEAEALALSLTAVAAAPEFAEPVKISILLAWAYAESVYDIRHLLSGGRIPLVKTAQSWHFGLQEMLRFREHLSDEQMKNETQQGLLYEDYLGILLLETGYRDKVFRMMDLIEMDLRQTVGNQNFRLDACMDYVEAEAQVESRYGYGCEITRSYYYY